MAGVNKVILLGYLGKDPEVRHLENDRVVANFSLATSEVYTNKQGERITTTEWHNIVLWDGQLVRLAEKYLKKGKQIYLEGKITNRSYKNKEEITKYISEVIGKEITLIGGKRDSQDGNSTENTTSPDSITLDSNEIDDLPF